MLINGEKLKSLREEYELTMKDVATRLGITEGTVSRYESGQIKRVSPRIIMGYSELFHVPANQLYQNPETEWLSAFSGPGMYDPRVKGFIEYLEEQAQKENEDHVYSDFDMELIVRYRAADERTKSLVAYALGLMPLEQHISRPEEEKTDVQRSPFIDQ